ncbi:von Willebrand factor C domain-containing protein 2-like [Mactra antiquata]
MRVLLAFSVLVVVCDVLLAATCDYNGVTYNAGESFQPSPCEHCFCSPQGGRAMCAIADCAMPPCVNPVHDPTKCCPTCPDGHNCRHSDGTIIKAGETYHPDQHTTCQCPTNTFGFGTVSALCAVSTTDQVVS